MNIIKVIKNFFHNLTIADIGTVHKEDFKQPESTVTNPEIKVYKRYSELEPYMLKSNISDILKRRRKQCRLTQQRMANRLGIAVGVYWKLENGKDPYRLVARLKDIARILGLTKADLLK